MGQGPQTQREERSLHVARGPAMWDRMEVWLAKGHFTLRKNEVLFIRALNSDKNPMAEQSFH